MRRRHHTIHFSPFTFQFSLFPIVPLPSLTFPVLGLTIINYLCIQLTD